MVEADVVAIAELGVIRTAGGRIPDALRSLYTIVGLGGGGTTAMGLVVVVHHTGTSLHPLIYRTRQMADEHGR